MSNHQFNFTIAHFFVILPSHFLLKDVVRGCAITGFGVPFRAYPSAAKPFFCEALQ